MNHMAQLVIPNAIQVRLKWNLPGGVTALNVLTAQSPSGTQPTQTITNTIGAAIKSSFASSALNAQIVTAASLSKVGVRWIGAANFAEFEDSGAAVAGTAVGDPLPKQTALCVTIRTAQAGKSYRGRVYLPGFGEASNDASGLATAAAQTAAAAFVTAVAANLASSGYTLGVGSRERSALPDAIPPIIFKPAFFTPMTVAVVRDGVWDTQRRRRT